jgi:hypothetical protein
MVSKYLNRFAFKSSILDTTYSVSGSSDVGGHAGRAACEVQDVKISSANRTATNAAVGMNIVERTIAAAAARRGQFKY